MDIVQAEKSNTIQSNKYSSVCTEREKDSDGNVETLQPVSTILYIIYLYLYNIPYMHGVSQLISVLSGAIQDHE